MARREAKFTTMFIKWCKHFQKDTFAFEVKVTTGKSIPFSVLKEHQLASLYNAKNGRFVWKIPDDGRQKPFDGFMMYHAKAYVVVYFDRPGNTEFFMIDIDDWAREIKYSDRKSLSEERIRHIGILCQL